MQSITNIILYYPPRQNQINYQLKYPILISYNFHFKNEINLYDKSIYYNNTIVVISYNIIHH